jgi:hypothetical protein
MKKIEFDFLNIGGLQKIYAVPPASFLRVREDITSGNCYLDLTRLDDVIDVYLIYDTAVFNEVQSRNTPGALYDVSISGIIPKSNPLNREQLLTLESAPFLVLFMDNNDNIRLAGNENNRLFFTRKETSGTLNSRNQIEFEFKGKQSHPCYFIHPQIFEGI